MLSIQYLYNNWKENNGTFNINETSYEYYNAFNKIILNKKLNKLNNYFVRIKEIENSEILSEIKNSVNSLYKEMTDSPNINSFTRKQILKESQIEEINEIAEEYGDKIQEFLNKTHIKKDNQ